MQSKEAVWGMQAEQTATFGVLCKDSVTPATAGGQSKHYKSAIVNIPGY